MNSKSVLVGNQSGI